MKTYTFMLTIKEGNDEFWENIENRPGCAELANLLSTMLADYGFHADNSSLELVRYKKDFE